MVLDVVRGDILRANPKFILFATNIEGLNDSGFAGVVSERYWNELRYCGTSTMGEIRKKTVTHPDFKDEVTFLALTCHSLKYKDGWKLAPEAIKKALDSLEDIKDSDIIYSVWMGAGVVGALSGANPDSNFNALQECNKKIIVYYGG